VATPKVALVTGASGGIGSALARLLASRGYAVVLHTFQNNQACRQLANSIREQGGEARVVQADLSDPSSPARLVEVATEGWQRLDLLVNNAATTVFRSPDALEEPEWDKILTVNLRAPFQLCQAAAPWLRQSRGNIVNISSTAAANARGSSPAYCASKAGLNNLTLWLARALAPEVRVNAVAPGFVETEWVERGLGKKLPSVRRKVLASTPLARLTEAEDVAQVVVSLLDMDQVTGQILTVDGGLA